MGGPCTPSAGVEPWPGTGPARMGAGGDGGRRGGRACLGLGGRGSAGAWCWGAAVARGGRGLRGEGPVDVGGAVASGGAAALGGLQLWGAFAPGGQRLGAGLAGGLPRRGPSALSACSRWGSARRGLALWRPASGRTGAATAAESLGGPEPEVGWTVWGLQSSRGHPLWGGSSGPGLARQERGALRG